MNTSPVTLDVSAAGWSNIYASYEPATDTVFVDATADNGDSTMVRWTRDGSGDICDDKYSDFAEFDRLTDALFDAVWAAAPSKTDEN